MILCSNLAVALLVGLMLVPVKGAEVCTKMSACSCQYTDGSLIDLSSLAATGQAQFQDVQDDQSTDLFSWNPCIPFSEGDCNSVAVCQIQPNTADPLFFNLGTQDSATFTTNDQGQLTLTYSSVDHGVLRTTFVALVCDESQEGTMTAPGERSSDLAKFDLTLKSKHACKTGGSTGLSAGTVLIIIFFSTIVAVLILGIPFQIFIKKESGVKVVPFSKLLVGLPGLVKDGVVFVLRRGKRSSYENK